MRRALFYSALGAALAYTVAIIALTDWLEIDWSFRPDEPTSKPPDGGLLYWDSGQTFGRLG